MFKYDEYHSSPVQARSVFQRLQLELTADSVRTLLHFFQGTITSASTVIVSGDEGGTEAGRAKIEAVAALGYVAVTIFNLAVMLRFLVAKFLTPNLKLIYVTNVVQCRKSEQAFSSTIT